MSKWILYDISDRKESRNGNDEYFIVSFFDPVDKRRAKTYITIGYRNNVWWGNIIVDDIFGIYEFKNLKTKQQGNQLLIDGDSIPKLHAQATHQEALAIVDIMK